LTGITRIPSEPAVDDLREDLPMPALAAGDQLQEDRMPEFKRRNRRQVALAIVAVAGAGAAIAISAVPTVATAAPRAVSHHHHHVRHHAKKLHIVGLVAAHHHRTVTVFAKTARAGAKTRHNQRIHVTFSRHVRAHTRIPVGNKIRITARGRAHSHHFFVTGHNSESVSSAPASLLFGTVSAINGTQLLVSEHARDNGDSQDGNDNQSGDSQGSGSGDSQGSGSGDSQGGSGGGGGGDNIAGDHGSGGSGDSTDGDSHTIAVDDSTATIIVDGGSGPLAVGDTVAILGEFTDNTVVASTIFGFSNAPDFIRGDVVSVSGTSVTLGSGDDNEQSDLQAGDDSEDGESNLTVDLADVPLALNGSSATPADLTAGDKIILLGTTDPETGQFTPAVAFAFNSSDNNPVGDNNDQGDDNSQD